MPERGILRRIRCRAVPRLWPCSVTRQIFGHCSRGHQPIMTSVQAVCSCPGREMGRQPVLSILYSFPFFGSFLSKYWEQRGGKERRGFTVRRRLVVCWLSRQ